MAINKQQYRFRQAIQVINTLQKDMNHIEVEIEGKRFSYEIEQINAHTHSFKENGTQITVHIAEDRENAYVAVDGEVFTLEKVDADRPGFSGAADAGDGANTVSAPMPGKILKMMTGEGDTVQRNQTLFIVEAMKMENEVVAPRDGQVAAVHFRENDLVAVGDVIVTLVVNEADKQ